MPTKTLSKQAFWAPSLEVSSRIDDTDKTEALQAAAYRFNARMRELESQCEIKASELRSAYLREVSEIQASDE